MLNKSYRYNFTFFYSRAGISYEDFLARLPHFDLKKAAVAKNVGGKLIIGEFTLVRKLVLRSFIEHFWSVMPSHIEQKPSLFKVSFSCDAENDIFTSSSKIYYYPEQITKSADFIFAPVSNPRYRWQSDLDHILLDSSSTKESRKIIHIWGSGNEGKTNYIKYKLIRSKVFGYFSTLFTTAQTATALIGAGIKSYYFADISRAVKETKDLFVMAEQLKDGLLASAFFGKDKQLVYETSVVVVFSNDLPPFDYLSKDRWAVYRINYDTEGASNLQQLSEGDYYSFKKA